MFKAYQAIARNVRHDLTQNNQQDRYAIMCKVSELMDSTGIGDEIDQGLNERLLGNLWALAEIEKLLPTRRQEILLQQEEQQQTSDNLPTMKQAERYMKYATAVYGPHMIASVQEENLGKANICEKKDSVQECIAAHVGGGVTKEDILVVDMDEGDSLECLRHVVTVDHSEKAVVLAIRGTLSLSSVYIDIAGYATDFCGGQAHAGIAAMARAVWKKAEASVTEKMFEFPNDYSLVITGHSLGAGVACLINIMIHYENLLPPDKNIQVKCMAYAPPPVFSPLEAVPDVALEQTFAYVHQYDVVPSMSCNGLRRLMKAVVAYDQRDLLTAERIGIEYGHFEPSKEIVAAVQQASKEKLTEKKVAPWLVIPTKSIVWLEEDTTTNHFNEQPNLFCCNYLMRNEGKKERVYSTALLDPMKLSQRLVDLTENMNKDHYPHEYEAAFGSIVSRETAAARVEEASKVV